MILPFREKSLEALRLGHQAPVEMTVYEGSIRSAKTFTSLHQWNDFILHSPSDAFLMSGNTLGSLSRNCLDDPEYGFIAITGGAAAQATDRDGSHFLNYLGKRLYLMGGNDAASFKKLQGLSIGGAYNDEGNLQHIDFIKTALGRSVASPMICNIQTINPEAPTHWYYSDPSVGIDRWGKDFVPDHYRRFHFTLDDNPAISDERKKRLAESYTGVFYKRYILGLRVRAEGGIYTSFVNNKQGEPGNVLYELPGMQLGQEKHRIFRITLGADFGGSKSATTFNATGWFVNNEGKLSIVTVKEHYDSLNKSVESILSAWKTFVMKAREVGPLDRAFGDSAEQLIIKSMNSCGAGVHVENAWKRPIIDRIRLYDVLYSQGRAFIMHDCTKTIEAVENAIWDSKKNDERLDDGSTNIDSLDAMEYAVERDASQLLESMRGAA